MVNGYGRAGGRVGSEELNEVEEVGRDGLANARPVPKFPPE